ncbi:hypothetical protein [Pelagibaculum spongiae]|uniref:hypothetical protein n=1 Tax=Pelagibaculum spongiae TaxID=2080658 RepID=UPI0010578C14|nr:hypothetical protein [Pelagibaculum spongiae]
MIEKRFKFLLLFLAMLMVIILCKQAELMFGKENQDQADLIMLVRTPISIGLLQEHLKELQNMTKEIDAYSLSEIKVNFEKTTRILEMVDAEITAQQKSWFNLSQRLKQDAGEFKKLKENLDAVQVLTSNELERINAMIEDASKPRLLDLIGSSVWAFILGIMSSVFATVVILFFKEKPKIIVNFMKRVLPSHSAN